MPISSGAKISSPKLAPTMSTARFAANCIGDGSRAAALRESALPWKKYDSQPGARTRPNDIDVPNPITDSITNTTSTNARYVTAVATASNAKLFDNVQTLRRCVSRDVLFFCSLNFEQCVSVF